MTEHQDAEWNVADWHGKMLVDRDGEAYTAEWLARWAPAEDFYFTMVRPGSSFDIVVTS